MPAVSVLTDGADSYLPAFGDAAEQAVAYIGSGDYGVGLAGTDRYKIIFFGILQINLK